MPPFFMHFLAKIMAKQPYKRGFFDRTMQLTGLEPLVTHLSDFSQTFFKFKVAKMTAILSVLCSHLITDLMIRSLYSNNTSYRKLRIVNFRTL